MAATCRLRQTCRWHYKLLRFATLRIGSIRMAPDSSPDNGISLDRRSDALDTWRDPPCSIAESSVVPQTVQRHRRRGATRGASPLQLRCTTTAFEPTSEAPP